jgi:ABC-2 type transport system permease protein
MSHPMVGKLIGKELSLNRFFMAAALLAGFVSIGISLISRLAFGIGSIMFLTVMVAYSVILPMFTIVTERKEKSRLFVLSLPVSRGDYLLAKVIGVSFSFLIPWTVLLIAALTVILATPVPNGMVVYTTLIMMFAFADFCVIACAAMLIDREGLMALVIICMNMSVTFFIVGISSFTSIGADVGRDVVNWSSPALTILGSEIAVVMVAFLILFWIAGREPEIV